MIYKVTIKCNIEEHLESNSLLGALEDAKNMIRENPVDFDDLEFEVTEIKPIETFLKERLRDIEGISTGCTANIECKDCVLSPCCTIGNLELHDKMVEEIKKRL